MEAGTRQEDLNEDALAAQDLYFNRELSWLDFNDRVLQLVENPQTPLMERVKFAAIYTSNLDEFFMIRVAGLHDQLDAGLTQRSQDGRTPGVALEEISKKIGFQKERLYETLEGTLLPALAEHGVRVVSYAQVDEDDRAGLEALYRRQIFPVLTPLAVGLGRPFPYISNLSLSLAVLLRDPVTDQHSFARIKVPKEMLPRFVRVGDDDTFVPLEQVISHNLSDLFPGMEILDHNFFRVTRDADFDVSDEADDLLEAVEAELRRRRFGEAIRVEVGSEMSRPLRDRIISALEIQENQMIEVQGMLDLTDLWELVKLPNYDELRDRPWTPVTQPRLQEGEAGASSDILGAMREGDILVHHPYDSFVTSVEQFVEQAVADPDVLAIKQTVYRTSDDSPLVPALIRATERGKQAVCLVELKARFDEQANIQWARKLEQAGVHVVYGHPSLKTHAKCVLVVRREGDGVRHYVHIGTGNYNPNTARLYTDFGLFTTDPELGADVADMFNYLTGYAREVGYRKALVAPDYLRRGVIEEIDRTIAAKEAGETARIEMKMNSLVDGDCIRALYRASQAGVEIDLNVRGICCLRPGLPGVSENVRVTSLVGRFLEHSRVYAFQRGDEQEVLIGSADLMPRNLDNRVELVAPVKDPNAKAEIMDSLERCFADTVNSWELHSDGTWQKRVSDQHPRDAHIELMARSEAAATLP